MDDQRWMRGALSLARRRLGQTWPNPAVGCVLVRGGRVLGRGATGVGGRPHAETEALRAAGDASGATAYVTLEPCAHHGRTAPCSQALIDAGVSRVVCATGDPDPRVAGKGIDALRGAGITVDIGVMKDEAKAINAGFLKRILREEPWVTLKLAATLDGRIATRTGESRWITGPASRRRVHLMRAQSDAILIGAGTARTDDPMLDIRGLGLSTRRPVRIVADGALSLPLTGRLASTAQTQPLWIMHRAGADPRRIEALSGVGAEAIEVGDDDGVLRMSNALEILAIRGLTRVMVEGGGRIAASLLSAGLVDEIALFTAGKTFGNDGTPAVQGFGLDALADAPAFKLRSTEAVGDDTLTWWQAPSSTP